MYIDYYMRFISDYIYEALIKKNTKINIDLLRIIPGKSSKWLPIEMLLKYNFDEEIKKQIAVTSDEYELLTYIVDKDLKGTHKDGVSWNSVKKIINISKLGPECNDVKVALNYLNDTGERKSKLRKYDADYVIWCINGGKMNPTGKTYFEKYNLWEYFDYCDIYMGYYGRSFLIGQPGILSINDKVLCVDNDNANKLSGAPNIIKGICKCNIDDFRKIFYNEWPSICKRPKVAFGKKIDGLPWTKMGQFYFIKGVSKNI